MSEHEQHRTVVVTGAAGGIGRAMVTAFRATGANVLAVDLDENGLHSIAADDSGVTAVVADITSGDDCDRIVAAAGARLDVLCNNAGILDRLALIDEMDDELWDHVLAVNLTGTFKLSRRAVVKMRDDGGGGVIVNTASTAAEGGGRAGPAYTASKAGVIALTKNIAVSCAEFGIRCNAILPGGTDTPMAHTGDDPRRALSERGVAMLARLQGKPPPAEPRQMADVAVFLASDAASRISGAAVPVDLAVFAY